MSTGNRTEGRMVIENAHRTPLGVRRSVLAGMPLVQFFDLGASADPHAWATRAGVPAELPIRGLPVLVFSKLATLPIVGYRTLSAVELAPVLAFCAQFDA